MLAAQEHRAKETLAATAFGPRVILLAKVAAVAAQVLLVRLQQVPVVLELVAQEPQTPFKPALLSFMLAAVVVALSLMRIPPAELGVVDVALMELAAQQLLVLLIQAAVVVAEPQTDRKLEPRVARVLL